MKPEERKLIDRVERMMQVVGNKWKPAIVFSLVFYGRQRFSELRRAIPDISQKMLTQRLRELERDGLVERTFHEEIPPRVEYEISALGQSLHPIFKMICDWGAENEASLLRANERFDSK
ncbi:MAG: transcriptional regulator [Acidobacteria bacterium]|nr:transcriptional regulator [Acidobacteriota bacterium]